MKTYRIEFRNKATGKTNAMFTEAFSEKEARGRWKSQYPKGYSIISVTVVE